MPYEYVELRPAPCHDADPVQVWAGPTRGLVVFKRHTLPMRLQAGLSR